LCPFESNQTELHQSNDGIVERVKATKEIPESAT
jgi:hypothetical protein